MSLDAEAFEDEASELDAPANAEGSQSLVELSEGGERARRVTEFLAKSLVDEPTGIEIDAIGREGETKLIVRAAPGDVGRLIGRRGRTVQAMRQVARAAGAANDERVQLDVVD